MFKFFLCKSRRASVCLTVITAFLCYLPLVWTTNIGIDTEQFILGLYGKNWLVNSLGRFGCYWSEIILNVGHFNPYFNGLVFLLLFSAAAVIWLYVFWKARKSSLNFDWLFPLVFFTYPLWLTQFYFTMQYSAISFALLLQGISFIMLISVIDDVVFKTNRVLLPIVILKSVFSVLCAFYAIGTYQAFPALHIAEGAACLILLFERIAEKADHNQANRLFWKSAFFVAAHFLLSYGLYTIVCRIMHWGTSDYLTINWGKQPAKDILYYLYQDGKNILLGRGDYTGWIMITCVILLALIWVMRVVLSSVKWKPVLKLDYTLLLAGNLLAGVILNFVIGSVAIDRARFPLFFSIAFLAVYSMSVCYSLFRGNVRKTIVVAGVAVILLSVFIQVHGFETCLYTMDVCNSQQYQTGADIVRHIEAVGGDDSSVIAVIGKWDAPLNRSCQKKGIIGQSSFNWDYTEDKPTSGTRRAVLYLDAAFGKQYSFQLDQDHIQKAISAAEQMPVYPSEGYVKKTDNLIVVKLSEVNP